MKRILLVAAIAALSTFAAAAADLPTKAPPALSYEYPTTKCGLYYGANTMGTTSAVENSAVGTQMTQGAIGLTLGYTCPVGAGFWFVDGMFDFANVNGSSNGLSASGPAAFEQRFGFGAPVNLLMSLIPGLSALQSAQPGLIPLPQGISVNTSSPYLFVGVHEDDISASLGLATAREWLTSVSFGAGNKVRLSNGVVFDPFAEYILPSTRMCLGPVNIGAGCTKLGAGFRVGAALEF